MKIKPTTVVQGFNRQAIQGLLLTNDRALERAIFRVYQNQTANEQRTEQTTESNGVGFSGIDAEILTSFAKQLIRGRTLSPKQLIIARLKMPKYWKQLLAFMHDHPNPKYHAPVQLIAAAREYAAASNGE
jgi:hypothetical protein